MTDLPQLQHRRELGNLLNQLNLCGQGVEVGVNQGRNAATILSRWSGKLLHLVDPWVYLPDYDDVVNNQDRQADLRATLNRLQKFRGRYAIWRMLSAEAAQHIPDDSQDFVYIDADHSYEGCLSDIRLWWPKIRPGGLIGGHDYHNRDVVKVPRGILKCGVKRAVTGFFEPLDLPRMISSDLRWDASGACREAPSWFVRKPAP